ncbi:MAG TPA: hypothetical protein VFG03_04625, partial [Telluria sp.]|nr:hypothetical protein [Telluria sp.]
ARKQWLLTTASPRHTLPAWARGTVRHVARSLRALVGSAFSRMSVVLASISLSRSKHCQLALRDSPLFAFAIDKLCQLRNLLVEPDAGFSRAT